MFKMSLNTGAKNVERGKRSSPSQKNSPNKCATSSKSETSKRGSKLSLSTIDKYLIKGPASVSSKRTNNNNISESDSKSSAESQLREKASDLKGSESPATPSVSAEPEGAKESSPESEIIVVDDVSDLDLHTTAKANGSKQNLSVSVPEDKQESKKTNEEEIEGSVSKASRNEQKRLAVKENEHKSRTDKGDSTDDVQSENETETQEYEISEFEDARLYVDYKDEDFNTDSEFENSGTETESKEKEGKSTSSSGSKTKTTAMGNCVKRRRQDACQGSSSEDEDDRPWRKKNFPGTKRTKQYPTRTPRASLRRQWSDRDTQQYRDGYPDKKDDPTKNMNLRFYEGRIRSRPDGAYIDDFHRQWWKNHDRLESHHGYIQWLFPIRESGMNVQAQELQPHEAKAISSNPETRERFLRSYEMMLYFYGIKLTNKSTGEVGRAENWRTRFKHLNHSMHNFLRITRILKCLGEMGFEHYKPPLLDFMLHEAIVTRELDRTLESCYNFWIGTIKDNVERERLKKRAEQGTSSRY